MKYKIIGIVMAAGSTSTFLPERIPAVTVTGVSFVLIFPW